MSGTKKEITVKLKWELDEAKINFVNKGIPLTGSFILKDIYLIKEDFNIKNTPNLEILSQSLLIRERTVTNPEKVLIYKKKNSENDEKCYCPLVDVNKTYELLTSIGYKECFRIEQECLEYSNKDSTIFLEYVHDLGLFLKVSNQNKNIENLIDELNHLEIAYFENDYFVKKANLMLSKIKKSK